MKTNSISRLVKTGMNNFLKKCRLLFFDPELKKKKKEVNNLCGIVKTPSFIMMATQEKIIVVARLLSRLEKEYGYAPLVITQTLLELNAQLNSSSIQIFSQLYS